MLGDYPVMYLYTEVVIGFEETVYSTTENDTRTVTVCASIRPGSPALAKTVEVELMSVDGSAIGTEMNKHNSEVYMPLFHCSFVFTAPEDYNAVTETLTFDQDNSRNCVEFTGFEDDVVDPNENFTVILTGGDDVTLIPDTAIVIILDQIRKTLLNRFWHNFKYLLCMLQLL